MWAAGYQEASCHRYTLRKFPPEDSRQLYCCLLPHSQLLVSQAIAYSLKRLQGHILHVKTAV